MFGHFSTLALAVWATSVFLAPKQGPQSKGGPVGRCPSRSMRARECHVQEAQATTCATTSCHLPTSPCSQLGLSAGSDNPAVGLGEGQRLLQLCWEWRQKPQGLCWADGRGAAQAGWQDREVGQPTGTQLQCTEMQAGAIHTHPCSSMGAIRTCSTPARDLQGHPDGHWRLSELYCTQRWLGRGRGTKKPRSVFPPRPRAGLVSKPWGCWAGARKGSPRDLESPQGCVKGNFQPIHTALPSHQGGAGPQLAQGTDLTGASYLPNCGANTEPHVQEADCL